MKRITTINASAGSGKTHRLMEEMSKCIEAGTQPEGLLATTFTVKAAAELQSRIRQKLLKKGNRELASLVFDGLIGTVNGVCNRLLNEYAIEAGLSPALDVLPEENADSIFSAATSDVMDEYAKDLEPIAKRLSLNPIKEKSHGATRDWKNDVRKILDLARSNRLDKVMLKSCGQKAVDALRAVFPATVNLSLDDIYNQVYATEVVYGLYNVMDAIQSFVEYPTWAGAAKLAKAKYTKTKDKDFPIKLFNGIGEKLIYSKELYNDMSTMIYRVFACAGDSLEEYARYKKVFGLVDFVDQECIILDLLENNPHFVQLMKERLSQIMVDEFQDTSPIQLALFLKLNECSANGSIWVGDPKQAIYAFRGTDPELMRAVTSTIPQDPDPNNTLSESWRSKEKLVHLSNAIFTHAFSPIMKPAEVALKIPKEREEVAVGGSIEAWHINGKNTVERMKSLAAGIAELIRDKDVHPNEICVLFWSNEECDKLTKALAEWNIPASAASGSLLETVECQLVMSAFRYCINPFDTVALATLLALYGETPDWMNRLYRAKAAWLALNENERKGDFLAEIRNIAFLKGLQKKADATPMEILEYVITELNLDRKVSAMKSSDRRMSNVDELRKCCAEYMNQALVERRAATPSGFVAALNTMDAKQAAGYGPNTVNVMTYHKSKGLEWPIVILGSLNAEGKSGAFDIRINQAESFDMNYPLKDRTIHYWPWPFGDSKKLDALDNALLRNPIQITAKNQEKEEGKRLLYVGLTRACDQVIFALDSKAPTNPSDPDTLQTAWLNTLSVNGDPLLKFPGKAGNDDLEVGTELFELETKSFSPSETIVPLQSSVIFADKQRDMSGVQIVPARLSPSKTSCEDGIASLLYKWDYHSTVQCDEEKCSLLGNAFHSFIALNPQQNRLEIAERLLKKWTVEKIVSPEVLLECTDNLYRWIAETYPNAKICCEVPITYHDENGTLYQGFIDMLLELPDCYVIIDHKTHPNASDAPKYAAGCAGQLRCYQKAVEAATGKRVRQTIIHLPNLGMCFEVK